MADVVYVVERGDVSYSELFWVGRDEAVAIEKARTDSLEDYPYESWVRRWPIDSEDGTMVASFRRGVRTQ